jgi:hypothetical protein
MPERRALRSSRGSPAFQECRGSTPSTRVISAGSIDGWKTRKLTLYLYRLAPISLVHRGNVQACPRASNVGRIVRRGVILRGADDVRRATAHGLAARSFYLLPAYCRERSAPELAE